MLKQIARRLTNNHKEVPLLYITLDQVKLEQQGEDGSCMVVMHPTLAQDEVLKQKLDDVVTHIRNNHNVKKL